MGLLPNCQLYFSQGEGLGRAEDGHARYLPACSALPRCRSPGLWPAPLGQQVGHWVLQHRQQLLLKHKKSRDVKDESGKVMKDSWPPNPKTQMSGDSVLPVSLVAL